MARGRKKSGKAGYMISAVAEMYGIHPQTLRLYEREGLLTPSRSEGNTRLYTEGDLGTLETILKLTRDLGVNLAGVQIIMNMQFRMEEMEKEMHAFVKFVQGELLKYRGPAPAEAEDALVHIGSPRLVHTRAGRSKREGPETTSQNANRP